MPLPARITQLQTQAVGAFLRRMRRTSNGPAAVRWISVSQLRQTAADVIQASIFARFADKREAMASSPREFYRLPENGGEVWLDYVADTADGFDATFATACCLAGVPGLTVTAGPDGDPDGTAPVIFPGRPDRADLLVFGGDEVYPVASALAYEERLNEVLRVAGNLAGVRDSPPVIALPGNHDWYDGLAAFRRNFCESWVQRGHRYTPPPAPETTGIPPPAQRDDVGGWGAFQSRSYFAVQLSERWWLWGLDSQLDAPIDAEQLAFFHDARRLLGDADVILCTASPSWLEASGADGLRRAGGYPALHPAVVHRTGARPGSGPDPAAAHRRPAPLRPLQPAACRARAVTARAGARRRAGAVRAGAGDLRGWWRVSGLHPPPAHRADPGLAALAHRFRSQRLATS